MFGTKLWILVFFMFEGFIPPMIAAFVVGRQDTCLAAAKIPPKTIGFEWVLGPAGGVVVSCTPSKKITQLVDWSRIMIILYQLVL